MSGRAEPKVYSIPTGVSFVDQLAVGILDRVGNDPLALAGVTVLLPTRRSCRSLREAFLRRSGGQPMLLPRMSPLGELDAASLSLTSAEELPGVPLELPDPISGLKRQMMLARLILQATGVSATTAQAVRLGADLGRLIDAVWTEDVAFDRLASLVPEDYAQHWQVTLEFLKIVTEHWPAILGASALTDPAQRRNLVLQTQAALWRAEPPQGLVIAAGSTGSIPASADLLAVVAALPQGAVVLPGLDLEADEASWDAIRADEAHPQHGLAHLLDRLSVGRRRRPPLERRGGAAGRPRPPAGRGHAPRRHHGKLAGAGRAGRRGPGGADPHRRPDRGRGGVGHRPPAPSRAGDAGQDGGAGLPRPQPRAPGRHGADPLGHRGQRLGGPAAGPHRGWHLSAAERRAGRQPRPPAGPAGARQAPAGRRRARPGGVPPLCPRAGAHRTARPPPGGGLRRADRRPEGRRPLRPPGPAGRPARLAGKSGNARRPLHGGAVQRRPARRPRPRARRLRGGAGLAHRRAGVGIPVAAGRRRGGRDLRP
ncbi:hypothetical protein [Azospirillum baldaniorum]|uniref:Double-strand break repair protein AddB n=1 Tax=Azospirillum baldaniorum TaxID=1064539 RepID=A0A9P1JMR1_9PROT|nr:protein of unknown function [Azospirillum baldaniorum]